MVDPIGCMCGGGRNMPESFFFHLRGPHFPMVLEECGNSMGKLLSQRGQSVCSNQPDMQSISTLKSCNIA